MAELPPVAITGLAAVSALGRGTEPQLAAALSATAAFGPVDRFDVSGRRVGVAATLAGAGTLTAELAGVIEAACAEARLSSAQRAATPLLLALHGSPAASGCARELARQAGLAGAGRVYIGACVSASTAVADAAALIRRGADRVVVAAGYLVEPDQFALFDAGQALSTDGAVRPFSAGRQGLLLGDAVAAMVFESAAAQRTGRRAGRLGPGRRCPPPVPARPRRPRPGQGDRRGAGPGRGPGARRSVTSTPTPPEPSCPTPPRRSRCTAPSASSPTGCR